jgi:hypothetical protein
MISRFYCMVSIVFLKVLAKKEAGSLVEPAPAIDYSACNPA